MKKYCLFFAIATSVFVLSGCGTGPATDEQTKEAAPVVEEEKKIAPVQAVPENTIVIRGSAFDPAELKVKAGTTVTWINKDPINHSIKGAGTSSPVLSTSQKFEHTFKTAGTYNYSCGIHPTMKGTVIVEADGTPATTSGAVGSDTIR